jgi:hypothetical protein
MFFSSDRRIQSEPKLKLRWLVQLVSSFFDNSLL